MILDYFRLREQVLLYGFFSCSNALLNFLLSIALVKYFLYGWQGRIYAQLICCVLCGTIGLVFFWRHNLIVLPQKSFIKKIIIWGIPIIPHLATNFVRQGCDRYIINYFHSLDDVGLFSFALNIANIIVITSFVNILSKGLSETIFAIIVPNMKVTKEIIFSL